MTTTKGYAIITPYYKEDRPLLQRCIDSVKEQSVRADHFMISDGHPQSWIDREAVRHIVLDRAHGDNGNTPRSVGALIAIAEEYDGVGMLDADNWFDKDHVEACLQVASTCEGGLSQCDYVVAQRRLRRPDETIMPIPEEPKHVDTSCFFFLKGSFIVIPYWATMPKTLSPICDRIFYNMLLRQPFKFMRVEKPTVNFHSMYESHYRYLGETPPIGAKPNADSSNIYAWINSLNTRQLAIANRLTGIDIKIFLEKLLGRGSPNSHTSRNALCSCGSGKKFKHCHGRLVT